MVSTIYTWAYDFKTKECIYYKILSKEDKTAEVVGFDKDINVLSYHNPLIPAEVRDYDGTTYKIIGIKEKAFYNSYLRSVTISEGVKKIGAYAFHSNLLTSITIPSTITSIGKEAFDDNGQLQFINVAKDNKVYDSRNDCNALIETATDSLIIGSNSTVIPDGVKIIGQNAFCDCTGLTSVVIPNSVTTIGDDAFYGCI